MSPGSRKRREVYKLWMVSRLFIVYVPQLPQWRLSSSKIKKRMKGNFIGELFVSKGTASTKSKSWSSCKHITRYCKNVRITTSLARRYLCIVCTAVEAHTSFWSLAHPVACVDCVSPELMLKKKRMTLHHLKCIWSYDFLSAQHSEAEIQPHSWSTPS